MTLPKKEYQIESITKVDKTKNKILIIYCGGTLGMVYDPKSKSLVPNDFKNLLKFIPEIERIDANLDVVSILNPIDSSNVSIENWIE